MKTISLFALLAVVCLTGCADDTSTAVTETQVNEMRSTAAEFMKELKGILIKEIQQGGVLNAVAVCSDTAQRLTNNFGLQRGVFVKRVSFNNRNESNFPDEYEKGVLNKFRAMHRSNRLSGEYENVEVIIENEVKYLRYMKPIFIQAECLNCHGSETDIEEETRKLLSQKYPDDKAINYTIGNLRGAVSIRTVIE
jgi:hypothetical protein